MKRHYVALIAALFASGYATAADTNSSGAEQAAKKAAVPEAAALAEEVKDAVAAEAADTAQVADVAQAADAVEVADAAEAAEAPGIAEAEDEDDRPRLICKREKPIGSKRIRKTCYTREQLDEQSRRTQDAMYRRNQRTGCPDCGGSGGG